MDLGAAVWPELGERPAVIVPLGSTEQHGPHLPISTDTVIARAVASALAGELDAYLAPSFAFGASGEHQGFPGVVSLGTQVLRLAVLEMVRSISPWASRVVLVNGHGGNLDAVRAATDQLEPYGLRVRAFWFQRTGDAHAGFTETSLMLHLAPDLVRLDQVIKGNTTPITRLLPKLVSHGVGHVSPTGVLGDARGATAEAGAELWDAMMRTVRHGL